MPRGTPKKKEDDRPDDEPKVDPDAETEVNEQIISDDDWEGDAKEREPDNGPNYGSAPADPSESSEVAKAQKVKEDLPKDRSTPFPAGTNYGAMNAPASQPPVNIVNNIQIPKTPVLVDEYYKQPYRREIVRRTGGQFSRVIPGQRADHSDDKVVWYDVEEGEALHVRSCEARIEKKDDGSVHAHPTDGRDPLPHGPGQPGCFGMSKTSV